MASSAAIADSPPRAARDKPRGTARAKPATETITAAAAKKNLDDVLKSAARRPVTVTRDGKPAVVMMRARRYREITRLLTAISDSEDRDAAEKMRQAEKEGYLTPEENAAFVREMRISCGI